MNYVEVPIIENDEVKIIKIFSENNKFGYVEKKDNKATISNNIAKLKNKLKKENLKTIKKIDNEYGMTEKVYNFFFKNTPKAISNEEIKTMRIELKIDSDRESKLKSKYLELKEAQKFNYITTFSLPFKSRKTLKYNAKSSIEKAIAIMNNLEGRILQIIGITGAGKTYSVKRIAENNKIDLFISTVSQEGDVKKSIFGEKTIENEDGKQKISHIPGEGLKAIRNAIEKKRKTFLFIDEYYRATNGDVLTTFSPRNVNGRTILEVKGVENYYPVIVENIIGEKGIVLLSDERNVEVDYNTGKLNKVIQGNEIDIKKIKQAMKTGNITKVTKDFLEKHGYKYEKIPEKIKEEYTIPEEYLKIIIAGNVGQNYQMKTIDDAVTSRALTITIDNMNLSPTQMIQNLKGKTIEKDEKLITLTKEEELKKEEFIENFFKAIHTGIKMEDVELPTRAYSMRNMETLMNVSFRPENKSIEEFLTEIIRDYMKMNFCKYEIDEENISINPAHEEFIESTLENIQKFKKVEKARDFNFDEEIENEEKEDKRKKIRPSI